MGKVELEIAKAGYQLNDVLSQKELEIWMEKISGGLIALSLSELNQIRRSACFHVWKSPLLGEEIVDRSGVLTEEEAVVACENGLLLPPNPRKLKNGSNYLEPLKWLEQIKRNSGLNIIVAGKFDVITMAHVWEMLQARLLAARTKGKTFMLVESDEYIEDQEERPPVLPEKNRANWGDNTWIDWATVWSVGKETGMRSWELGLELIGRFGGQRTIFILPETALWMSGRERQLLKLRAQQINQAGCEVETIQPLVNTSSTGLRNKFKILGQ
jgi:hypothetical protein